MINSLRTSLESKIASIDSKIDGKIEGVRSTGEVNAKVIVVQVKAIKDLEEHRAAMLLWKDTVAEKLARLDRECTKIPDLAARQVKNEAEISDEAKRVRTLELDAVDAKGEIRGLKGGHKRHTDRLGHLENNERLKKQMKTGEFEIG